MPCGSKDRIDLTILKGDVERWAGDESAARVYYGDALTLAGDDTAPLCEMRARAHLGRAASYAAEGAKKRARDDYLAAAAIYQGLEEWEEAAAAQWQADMLEPPIPLSREEQMLLEREAPTVRIEALRRQALEEEERGRGRRAALAQRRGARQWERQITEARVEAARKSPPW